MTAPSELPKAAVQLQPPLADWLEALSHDSPFERGEDPSVWDQVAPRLALVPVLISLLKDSDRDVRVRVITALGTLGAQAHRVLPVIRAGAQGDGGPKITRSPFAPRQPMALLQVGPEPDSEVAGLIDALQNELDVLRFHAAIALGNLGRDAEPAVSVLIHTALWDQDPGVRVEAAVALWKIDRTGPLVIPVLIKALADDNELICWIAADCLGQIGPEAHEAVPALQQALRRPFKMALIRRGVVLALERIDPHAAAAGELLDNRATPRKEPDVATTLLSSG